VPEAHAHHHNIKEATMKSILTLLAASTLAVSAFAKLPPPSDEAKAKAAEAAAKTAHAGKVDAFLLCKYQDKVAAHTAKNGKAGKKDPKAAPSAPCADPGAFVYTPAPAATPTAAAPAPAPAAAPAAAAPAKKS
jgi:hypothetical protein